MRRVHVNILAGFLAAIASLGASAAQAQAPSCAPMRPLPAAGSWSVTLSPDGTTSTIDTAPSFFPPGDSSGPNPTNLLPTMYVNACDSKGKPIPNTLPSSPDHPYNLHPDPVVTPLTDSTSPTDDLQSIIAGLKSALLSPHASAAVDMTKVQFAIDILEGNPVSRAYSGFPLLHYTGPNKTKTVMPIMQNGIVVGGTVTIHQVWYDTHVESDTAYLDPTAVNNVPWTIHYVVDVLNRGYDDFAGYVMYFDDPNNYSPPKKVPGVGLDNTFFPMSDGSRFEFDIAMAPARFWNLTYHWGWRKHPPRVQVVENVLIPMGGRPRNAIEFDAFCPNNQQPNFTCPALQTNPDVKAAAIGMIGDVAPAKRMWNDFQALKVGVQSHSALASLVADLESAFDDWQHRTRLPAGVPEDPNADETLLFVNDTIYGHVKGFNRDMEMEMFKFKKRGDQVTVKLLNGDYFPHAYMLVDFGGIRGWENTFQNTMPIGGQGPLFTFGRNSWWINTASGPIPIPVATRPTTSPGPVISLSTLKDTGNPNTPAWNKIWTRKPTQVNTVKGLGMHTVVVNFKYDPPSRLRMYQFDGFHHDIGIWSPH
jgi:hypothetical protein